MPQDLPLGLGLIATCVGLYALAVRLGGRAADPLKPRLIPWRTVSVVFGVGFLFAVLWTLSLFRHELPVSLR